MTVQHDRDMAELELSRRSTPVAWLLRHEHEQSDAVAIRFEGQSTTWAQFGERVRSTAAVLAEHGVGVGDRVVVLMPNRPEFQHVALATMYLGAILVPVNFRLAAGEVSYLVSNSEPTVVVTDDSLLDTATAAVVEVSRAESGGVTTVLSVDSRADGGPSMAALAPVADPPAPAVVGYDDDAAIMYTSGTTGRPKGAVLSYQNFVVNALRTSKAWDLQEYDVMMLASPLFHIAAFCAWMGSVDGGATALLMPSTGFDATRVLDTMEAEGVTTTFLVPAQWQMLCDEPRVAQRDLKLRYLSWGAAPATEALLRRMMAAFPGAQIVAAFGQTETTASGVWLRAADSLRKIGSVGKAIYSTSIRVVDGRMNDVGVDEVGEIVYRGPGVMSRFWRNEEATAEAFRGGWFHSGDLVRRDAEGFLYVVDRIKDMIISGGENIYCAELENVIADHPSVAQVAVVGRDDEKWGEVPVAVIVPTDASNPPSLEDIRAFCDGRLARYKLPKGVVIQPEFPRSGTGKVQKNVLRELV